MPQLKPRIVVVGSLNVDLIARVPALPTAGETVFAARVLRRFGGKGANQALAAARQGAEVFLIGAVGDDAHGADYKARWRRFGLNASGIASMAGRATGVAFITVDDAGENQIVVSAGANASVTAKQVRDSRAIFAKADAVLLQNEVPQPAILEAMRLARQAGARVVFNPSPCPEGFPWGEQAIDALIVNVHEAQRLFCASASGLLEQPGNWQRRFARRRIENVIVTRGATPTILLSDGVAREVPTLAVKPVDTVGAGDAFAGVLATRWAEGGDLVQATRAANVAGALATLREGAQEAIPTKTAVSRALGNLPS